MVVCRIMYGNDWEWKTHIMIRGNAMLIKQILIQMMEFFSYCNSTLILCTKPKHQLLDHFQIPALFEETEVFWDWDRATMEMEFCIYSRQTWVLWPKLERYFLISLNLILRFDEGIKSQNLRIISSLGGILTYCLRQLFNLGNDGGF